MKRVSWSLAPLFAAALFWSGGAAASPSFPGDVDTHLMLTSPKTVEEVDGCSNMGCLLCHLNCVGGDGTNNEFGSLLLRYGAVGDQDTTVGPALDALAAADMKPIQDIEDGVNPNDDPQAFAGQPPEPTYGCSVVSRPASDEGFAACVGLALLASASFRRRSTRA
jgi:hypothetical protein